MRFLTKVYLLVGTVLLAIILLGVQLHRSSESYAHTHLRVGHATAQLEAVLMVREAFDRYLHTLSLAGGSGEKERLWAGATLTETMASLRKTTVIESRFVEREGGADPDDHEGMDDLRRAEISRLVRVERLVSQIRAFRGAAREAPPSLPIAELQRTLDGWVQSERAERNRILHAASTLHARVATVARTSAVLVFVLVAVGVFLVFSRFRRSLSDLLAGCARLAEGNLAARIPEQGDAEFAALAVAFNRMAGNLQDILRREVAATERAARAEAHSQTSKMTAIGQLASGVAHEINNPLGVILGFAQGMEQRVKEGDPMRLPVGSIVREALRCKALVKELLTFARAARKTLEPVHLNTLVKDSSVLLESRAKTQSVQVRHDLAPSAPIVVANQSQLQQIIVNLGTNALDAMTGGGVLTLRTRTSGASASLEVIDTGSGIPQEILDRIFDPFFTTKDPGKGTGLGLSLVHEIVQQHGGSMRVESEAGKGTTMSVVLPAERA